MDRESDGKIGSELLGELFSALEDLETQSAGILQFLKGKGLATDEELAPYLRQAADASNVRWRAARIRMEALLASAINDAKEEFAREAEERARKESPAVKQQEQQQSDVEKLPQRDSEDAGSAEAGRTVSGGVAEEKNEADEAKSNQPARDEKRNDKESPSDQVEVEKSEAKKEAAGPNDDSPNSAETDTSKKAA
ncbi:MAG: hypothetical protein WBV46_12840 [Terriglobales bacterium]